VNGRIEIGHDCFLPSSFRLTDHHCPLTSYIVIYL
jgi:hypothetical protein